GQEDPRELREPRHHAHAVAAGPHQRVPRPRGCEEDVHLPPADGQAGRIARDRQCHPVPGVRRGVVRHRRGAERRWRIDHLVQEQRQRPGNPTMASQPESSTRPSPTTYDVHTHVGLDTAFYLSGWWPYAATVQELLEHMDASGIAR